MSTQINASVIAPDQALNKLQIGLFVVSISLFALITRIFQLDDPIFYDEYYHILAGKSWASDGSFTLFEGAYERAPLYTTITGWLFRTFSSTEAYVARAPNVLAGVFLVVVASLWTRTTVGRFAGWIAAILLICWPNGMQMSQIVRFYALQGLTFFVMAIAIYHALQPQRSALRTSLFGVVAAVFFWISLQLQESTLVGLAGIILWIGFFVIIPWVYQRSAVGLWLLLGLGFLALAALIMLGVLDNTWERYRSSPWDKDPTAYHRQLRTLYPLLWPLTPILALFAVREFGKPASFCLVVAGFGILAHSLAGVQNLRHIYYLSPFLFALWAMGLQATLPAVIERLNSASKETFYSAGTLLSGLACAFAVLANEAVTDSLKEVATGDRPRFEVVRNFGDANAIIASEREQGAVVVATNDLEAVYYFGGLDVVFSQNWLPVMKNEEFAIDPRTGRPLISKESSLKAVVQSHPRGVLVASRRWWADWPGYAFSNFEAFLDAFNQDNVTWQLQRQGSMNLLLWETEVTDDTVDLQRIRQLIPPRKDFQ